MRLTGFLLAFALLSISIVSYGVTGSVSADDHNIPPFFATTELASYGFGDKIVINGKIKDYDPSRHEGFAITLVIKSPDNSLVEVAQPIPDSDGMFSHELVAGGKFWKSSGDYVAEFNFNSMKTETTIVYTGGEPVDIPPMICGPDQVLVDGACKDLPPPEPVLTCGPDQELVDGECVDTAPPPTETKCGDGTTMVNGQCRPIEEEKCPDGYSFENGVCVEDRGGCLIATAAYGTELAPQIQMLREVRDNTVLSTASGTAFMTGFNTLYYSFAPTVADWERENPMFKQTVKAFITPMVSTLSIMTLADSGSEIDVLGLGISVIALNLGMYVVAPALIGFKVHQHFKSRK